MEQNQQNFSIGYVILTLVLLMLIQVLFFAPHTATAIQRIEIVFGDVSTGAQDDLQRTTDIARQMITRYGMNETLGRASLEEPRQALFLHVPSDGRRDYSEETGRMIDTEIRQVL